MTEIIIGGEESKKNLKLNLEKAETALSNAIILARLLKLKDLSLTDLELVKNKIKCMKEKI